MKILVTGAAGFIGHALSLSLLEDGHQVTGFDNLNQYYDQRLKMARVDQLVEYKQFDLVIENLSSMKALSKAMEDCEIVVHLAAQAGVRHSLTHPRDYIESNISGFLNVLEACRNVSVKHLFYASSSSVYGHSLHHYFKEDQPTNDPASLYAVTKKTNEQMARVYAHLYGLKSTGMRFFTVYGPWGRPDMALFKFVHNILNDEPITLYNKGNHTRSFTYISDIVTGIRLLMTGEHEGIFNLGSDKSVELCDFVQTIEIYLGKQAKKLRLPLQAGDVPETHADISKMKELGWQPEIRTAAGIPKFIDWYREYYGA